MSPMNGSSQSQPVSAGNAEPSAAVTPGSAARACPECNGDGGWERPTGGYNLHDGSLYTVWQECPECRGSGEGDGSSTPEDVRRLVVAARHVAFGDLSSEALRELDLASEAFAARVPWENEPADADREAGAPRQVES